VLAVLEAGCAAPLGALAEVVEGEQGEELWVRAVASSTDGAVAVRRSASGPTSDPEALGRSLAEEMLAQGAKDLIDIRPIASSK
jgi:hydroxymethylbilane synthase